jgi:Cdc6-like AAA superfamily ATPase
LKVKVNHTLLSDAPLHDGNKPLFTIAHKDTNDFIEDLVRGNPTCYLVSGYRGSGKSSFVKRIESEINELNLSADKEAVFVYTNFPKYHEHGFLLRKLIRCFYNTISKFPSYGALEKNKETRKKKILLQSLYEKTFYETTHQSSETIKREYSFSADIDWVALVMGLLGIASMISAVYRPIEVLGFDMSKWIDWVVGAALLAGGFVKGTLHYKRKQELSSELSRKSMYDDEIADYYFLDLLESFKEKYRIIFVLDELDKISEEEIRQLLNEMKPFFISGSASFVVVAGQNLFHQYFYSRTVDDALLSSLFSKYIHVPLFSLAEFENLFGDLLVIEGSLSDDERKLVNQFAHYLVYEAKRIPRRFIGLIRQNITWQNGEAFLFIEPSPQLEVYAKVNKVIETICEKEIIPENMEDAVKDYYIMQLYIKSQKILAVRRDAFTVEDLK